MTYPPHRFGRIGLAFARLFGGRVHKGVRVRGMVRCRPGGPVFIGLGVISTLMAGVLVLAGLLAARLTQGPITLEMLKAPMSQALEQRVGNGYRFDNGDVRIEKGPYGFGLIIQSLSVKDAEGHVLLAAPKALVGIDMLALLVGEVKPTRLDLAELEVRVAVKANGAIALAAGTETAEPITLSVPPGPAAPAVRSRALASATAPTRGLAAAIAATVDLATHEQSPLGALVHVGIADGRLVIEDRVAERTIVFSNFDLGFEKDAPGEATLTVAASGPNGRWSANAKAAESADRGRTLDLQFKDLSLAEFMLAGGVRNLPFATIMPISGRALLDIDAEGVLRGAEGDFSLGAGVLHIDDPDQKPFRIDEVTGRFRLDPAKGRIDIEKAQYFAQETSLDLHGSIGIPDTADAPWSIALAGQTAIVAARPYDPSLRAKVDVAALWEPAANKLSVTRMQLSGPDIDAGLNADFRAEESGPHLVLRIGVGKPVPVAHVGSLWPTYVQPKLRSWILAHVVGGHIDSGILTFDCDAACFAEHARKRPMPVDALDVNAALSGIEIAGVDGMPRMSAVAGTAKVRARSASFSGSTADLAGGGDSKLTLTDWSFDMPDTVPTAMPVTGSARLESSIASLRGFLRSGTLSKLVTLPPELDAARGQIDARLAVDFTINGTDAPALRGNARVTNLTVEKVVGDEKLENCTLNVSLDGSGVRAKGEGRIFGASATLDVKKPAEGPGEASLQATLDDAFRARRGLSFGTRLSGPVIVRATTPLGRDKTKAQVEADFTRAKIDNLLPGWNKAAGRPAKVTLTVVRRQDYVALQQISLDSAGATIRGNAEIAPSGAIIAAKLTQLRIGNGDDMRVDLARSGDGLRIAIRAGTIDARPLLRGLAVNSATPAAKSALSDTLEVGKALDLDIKAQTVTGLNQKVIKNLDLKLTKRSAMVSQLRLSARIGRGTLTAHLDPGAAPLLTISAGDAGAALAFFDFYKHMEGGQLEASIQMGADSSQAGSAAIDQFVLRDEPAISRVSAQAEQEGAAGSINLNPALVRFNRFQTVFTRGGGKVTLRDTVMWGSEIGATVEGTVDFARDYVNLHGTFVPAYALNNMFSKIPFFGPILGGGSNEGLFAVNYRVSGAATSPTVSINLLTAIAPGFLRQIFGAIDGSNGTSTYRTPDASAYASPSRQLAFPSTQN